MKVRDLVSTLMEMNQDLPVVMLDGSFYVSVDGVDEGIAEYSDFMDDGEIKTGQVAKIW